MKKTFNKYESRSAYLFILPSLILLFIFVILPLLLAVYRSFFDYRYGQANDFVMFNNYISILRNEIFFQSFRNVLVFSFIITFLQIILSFLFANLLTKLTGKIGVFSRTIIYLPHLISGIVVAVIFTLMTTYNGGIINSLLGSMDIDPIPFNNDPFWSPISIIVPSIWIGFGYYTLVMYAGIINIPKDYFEAAKVDGANMFQSTLFITIPCMKNYFILMIVTQIVGNLQMFEIPMIMTNGQPANKTMTPVLYLIHSRANGNISDSEITAASILIMIMILLINSLVFYLMRTKKRNAWEM